MKRISKKIMIITIMMIIALSGLSIVNAASVPVNLTSNSKLVAGSTVTIDIKVDNPVYGISTTLSYDTDVFESATVSSKVAASADLSNNVIVIESGNVMPAGTIGTITLKVKANLSKTEGIVSISNGKATDETISTQDLNNTSITIKADVVKPNPGQNEGGVTPTDPTTPEDPETPTKPTESTTQGQNGNQNTIVSTTNTKTDNTTAKNNLPKTGETSSTILVCGSILLMIVAIISYVVYKK